jgi:hypothetical protein
VILGTKTFARTAESVDTVGIHFGQFHNLSTSPMAFSAYNQLATCFIPFLFYVKNGLL